MLVSKEDLLTLESPEKLKTQTQVPYLKPVNNQLNKVSILQTFRSWCESTIPSILPSNLTSTFPSPLRNSVWYKLNSFKNTWKSIFFKQFGEAASEVRIPKFSSKSLRCYGDLKARKGCQIFMRCFIYIQLAKIFTMSIEINFYLLLRLKIMRCRIIYLNCETYQTYWNETKKKF